MAYDIDAKKVPIYKYMYNSLAYDISILRL